MGAHTDRPPADQGLSSLGLIMSLTGSVMAPLMGAMLLGQIKVSMDRAEAMARYGGNNDSQTLWLFLILIAAVVRSLVHRMAGLRLCRDGASEPSPLSGINAYMIAAGVHTALWIAFLKVKSEAPSSALVGVAVLLMAWPLAIFLVTRQRRFQKLSSPLPVAEDNGFEGLAVLMSILGFAGLLGSLVVVVIGFSLRDESSGLANVLLVSGTALSVRSIIHVSVGVRAARGAAVKAIEDFLRYGNVGMAIGAAVGALLTLYMFWSAKVDFIALAMGLGITLALLAWPALVRRFVTWRHLSDLAGGETRRRSPDAGITALGWLLLAGAAATLGSYVAAHLWEGTVGRRTSSMMLQMAGIPFSQDNEWWALPLGLAELWAALELLAVSPRRKLVASLWGAAALVVTTIATAPDLRDLLDARLEARVTGFAVFLLAITPAAATLLLVNRPRPPAVARAMKAFE